MKTDRLERLRLLEAWRKPGGPTPKEKMPNTYKTVKEAADALETLMEHAEAMAEALSRIEADKQPRYHDCVDDGYPQCAWCDGNDAAAAFRAAFPGEG